MTIDEAAGSPDSWLGFDLLVRVPHSLSVSHTYVGIRKCGVVKKGTIEAIGSDLKCRFLLLFWCNVDLTWGKPVWAAEVPEMQEVAGVAGSEWAGWCKGGVRKEKLSGSSRLLMISFVLSLEQWENVKGPKLWCDQTSHLKIAVWLRLRSAVWMEGPVGSFHAKMMVGGTREYSPGNAETRVDWRDWL